MAAPSRARAGCIVAAIKGVVVVVLLVAGAGWLLDRPSPGDGVTSVLEVHNSCSGGRRVFVGLADAGEVPPASEAFEIAAGETHEVTIVHGPDRDPTGDRLEVAIGTSSRDLDAVLEASPSADPPTVTVTGSCLLGEPCTVAGTAVRCTAPPPG